MKEQTVGYSSGLQLLYAWATDKHDETLQAEPLGITIAAKDITCRPNIRARLFMLPTNTLNIFNELMVLRTLCLEISENISIISKYSCDVPNNSVDIQSIKRYLLTSAPSFYGLNENRYKLDFHHTLLITSLNSENKIEENPKDLICCSSSYEEHPDTFSTIAEMKLNLYLLLLLMDFGKVELSNVTMVNLPFLPFRYLSNKYGLHDSSKVANESDSSSEIQKNAKLLERNERNGSDQNIVEIEEDRKPIKLSMKQGLLMNQVLAVYALENVQNELCKNHTKEFKRGLRVFEPWALQNWKQETIL
ncbi:hypothetical protein NQ318_001585 [Aromia moschata]|uniref:Uncharacterized protein n=1 Tax=Aromia moschata TaxID=1265417 RepID=A0AAV8Y1M3_9CUCU|nr:hypothetical protein NQ318_001585 [Aromia moschata]